MECLSRSADCKPDSDCAGGVCEYSALDEWRQVAVLSNQCPW